MGIGVFARYAGDAAPPPASTSPNPSDAATGPATVRAQTAGVIASLESVYGILFAVITIGERPSLKELAGGALIIGTVAVLTVCTKGQK